MSTCGTPAATLADAQVERWTKSTIVGRKDFTDTIPPDWIAQNPTGFATYALEDRNERGKSAGLSNLVKVSLAPTLPAPAELQAKVTSDGVELNWTGAQGDVQNPALSYLYRVFRQTEGENKPEVVAGEVGGNESSYVDHSVEWEKTYSYRVAPITRVKQSSGEPIEVEGDDASVNVDAHDTFAPAVPTGLQAVFSGVGQKPFMDLTWAPNLEQDLAGYNVYRHEAGTQAQKISGDLVKTPSFRDDKVEAGHQYFYSVAAVDERGNESERSEEASETVK
jgi:fibronectin type 3 domain-containing protein